MKLVIGPKILVDEKKSGFFIECDFMHGDADKNEKDEFKLGSEDEAIQCLEWIERQPSHPSEGGDDEEWNEWREEGFIEFPYDVVFDGQLCQLDGHEIFFYDADGLKHSVDIVT